VLEVRKEKTGELGFFVEELGEQKWIHRSELIRDHPMALAIFYEERLDIKKLLPPRPRYETDNYGETEEEVH
jgi:hypothetical protein